MVLFVMIDIKNNGAYMNADNYKISTLPYIENASNEIMEKYNMKRNRLMAMPYILLL